MCTQRLASCPVTCGHKQLILDYYRERERQETLFENNFRELDGTGYKPLTFKDYLKGIRK